ncbi:hypothetical protein VNO77_26711 [Canavalia gladiata]|uniref:Uncharacterized protein n=1 Tax=Canavalia gladiata TaxID=3824 RepID=A0AAN9KUJ9_CANGL
MSRSGYLVDKRNLSDSSTASDHIADKTQGLQFWNTFRDLKSQPQFLKGCALQKALFEAIFQHPKAIQILAHVGNKRKPCKSHATLFEDSRIQEEYRREGVSIEFLEYLGDLLAMFFLRRAATSIQPAQRIDR